MLKVKMYLLIILLSDVATSRPESIQNSVSVVGSVVTLECRYGKPEALLSWFNNSCALNYTADCDKYSIYTGYEMARGLVERFHVACVKDQEQVVCNLIIKSVGLQDVGTYVCHHEVNTRTVSHQQAEVTVMRSDPVCTRQIDHDEVEAVSCIVHSKGNNKPFIRFIDRQGSEMDNYPRTSSEDSSTSYTEYETTLRLQKDERTVNSADPILCIATVGPIESRSPCVRSQLRAEIDAQGDQYTTHSAVTQGDGMNNVATEESSEQLLQSTEYKAASPKVFASHNSASNEIRVSACLLAILVGMMAATAIITTAF